MHTQQMAIGTESAKVGRTVGLYLQAMRVKSLWISSICVLTGGAVALWHGNVSLVGLFLAWLGAVSVQAGTNLTNVFYNYKAGSAREPAAGFDPEGSAAPVRTGKLASANVERAAMACFAVGVLAGIALTAMFGWRILAMGVPGLLAGYFYAAPPVRLAYLGLGVITVFVFMGPVMVIGTYWVESGSVSWSAALASLAVGLMAAGIMHINDVRDFDSDRAHGKRTLSITVGRNGASALSIGMNVLAYLAVVGGVATRLLPWPVLATLVTIPVAVQQGRLVVRERSPSVLNGAWFMGVKLHTQFGVLLIAGLLAARFGGW